MKLAYERYSGAMRFAAEQFRNTAEEVAGVDLQGWFNTAVAATDELDYAEALERFGLRFAAGEGEAQTWRLEVGEEATTAQRANLKAWLEPARE